MPLIRPGRDADSAGVIALIARCWTDYPNCVMDADSEAELGLRAPASHYAAQGGALWVADTAGAVAGMIAAAPRDGGAWEVCRMYVHPDRHGTGLAHRLLDAAEAHALAAGATRLLLWTDTQFDRAHRFYEKRSYVRTGPIRALESDPDILEFGYAKPVDGVQVLDTAAAASAVRRLADILVACADRGASALRLPPLTHAAAQERMRRAASDVAQGRSALLAAWRGGLLAGMVRLRLDTPPNQPHRAEVADLLVHPDHRRRGVAQALMHGLDAVAAAAGRQVLTCEAESFSPAEALCIRLHWTLVGRIPACALNAAGRATGVTVSYKLVGGSG